MVSDAVPWTTAVEIRIWPRPGVGAASPERRRRSTVRQLHCKHYAGHRAHTGSHLMQTREVVSPDLSPPFEDDLQECFRHIMMPLEMFLRVSAPDIFQPLGHCSGSPA